MKTKLGLIIIFICVIIAAISTIYIIKTPNNVSINLNPTFQKQMVGALNLQYVNSDTLYRGAWTKIFNDTIVGYQPNEDVDSCFYFIQSLKTLKYKVRIHVKKLIAPCSRCATCATCITNIDCFRNGCLYSGRFGNPTMLRICSDGTITHFFGKYRNIIFYADKIILYKNKVVITRMNGIDIFDMLSEKLLWKYTYDLNQGSSAIIGNKLVFTFRNEKEENHVKSFVHCVDLDKLTTVWKTQLTQVDAGYAYKINGPWNEILNNGKELLIPTISGLSIISLDDGSTKFQFNYNKDKSENNYSYAIESDRLYFSSANLLMCFNIKSYTKAWQTKNVFLHGIYKSNIVAQSNDRKSYIIIDKSIGKVKAIITNPYLKENNVTFIDKYLLFHGTDLYK